MKATGGIQMTVLIGLAGALIVEGAEIDESRLPPPATVQVDFERDIRPIFEAACLKCHGLEKPKSGFQLTRRETALKGGDNGIDILPGQSARSPLIHYVARLVEDMEMPPPGKGDPLTREQIGLLRAWIDQGAAWPESAAIVERYPQFTVQPAVRWISVSGDERKFREQHWMREGWSGGVDEFSFKHKLGDQGTLNAEGNAFFGPNHFRLTLGLEQPDLGFARVGFEQLRHYYDDSGGYYEAFAPASAALDRDLHLDVGRAWAGFGLTLPAWPRIAVGYEYQYRDGVKSTLQWGDAGPTPGDTRKIYPAYKEIDEQTHILKFDLSHDIRGVAIEDNLRVEFYDLETRRQNAVFYDLSRGTLDKWEVLRESHDHFQAANTFRLEKLFREGVFASGGYLYSRLDGEAAFANSTLLSPTAAVGFGPADTHWFSNQILLEQDTHIFNLNSLLGPWEGLTFAGGLQSEWMRQKAFGDVRLDEGIPGVIMDDPAVFDADIDKAALEENIALRYTGLPYTVLFAEARFQQENIGQSEISADNHHEFLRDTDATSDRREYRAGFSVSPWRTLALNAHFKRRQRRSHYDHDRDEAFGGPNDGYSAFIRSRDLDTDEVEAKLVWKPLAWWKNTLTYRWTGTDYRTRTDSIIIPAFPPFFPEEVIAAGGGILAGTYDAHAYSLNIYLTPWRRLLLSGTFSYRDTRTVTAQNGNLAVVDYQGDLYSLMFSSQYVLDDRTDLHAVYSFSRGDYRQDNAAAGLPLGLVYDWHHLQVGITRRLKEYLSTRLEYALFHYDEPSGGHHNDYTAHGVFGTFIVQWP